MVSRPYPDLDRLRSIGDVQHAALTALRSARSLDETQRIWASYSARYQGWLAALPPDRRREALSYDNGDPSLFDVLGSVAGGAHKTVGHALDGYGVAAAGAESGYLAAGWEVLKIGAVKAAELAGATAGAAATAALLFFSPSRVPSDEQEVVLMHSYARDEYMRLTMRFVPAQRTSVMDRLKAAPPSYSGPSWRSP